MYLAIANIGLFLILLFLSAFFSGSETALFSLSKISVKRLKYNNARNSGVVESLLNSPTELLITILIGNMFANVFASSMAASISLELFGEGGLSISIPAMTVLVVVFCEIIPKIVAINNAKSLALTVAPFINIFSKIVLPLKSLLSKLAKMTLLRLSDSAEKAESGITMDELESAIKVSYAKEGIIDKEEAEMIEDVLQLSYKKVSDVMVPGEKMVSFSAEMPLAEMAFAIKEADLSRIPVYSGSKSNIIGILYSKELLRKRLESGVGANIRDLLKEPFYISSGVRLTALLKEFRSRKIHLAIVQDEDGRLAGLVTLEDLLEEIIGDIRDKERLLYRIRHKISSKKD